MRSSIVHLGVGIGLGLVLAVFASGALRPVLYRVDPRDASVFAGVVVMLVVVSLIGQPAAGAPSREDRSGQGPGDRVTGEVAVATTAGRRTTGTSAEGRVSTSAPATSAAKAGIGFGSALAITISWSVNKSILWAIIHGFLGWIYVIYYALKHP